MVCVDQKTGCKTKEPFSTLAKTRRSAKGKIEFGVHLLWREDLNLGAGEQGGERLMVTVGDRVALSNEDEA